ncbi:hypothetical protein SAMN05518672_11020 [Chitinophaga sp. CF118]|uniref:hypothetical protein n=1 Tax=Chitinophaga sp. CF118 TaxID=1884367 RepID=UPI0008E5EEF3|nr:hypothetical protein [Chitinophaga sp. CF118]SFE76772.1 hypothetical protein SAMN05518672_11020 [Chitinophaga sp. CF118]
MKKKSEKKLSLGKIKIASLSQLNQHLMGIGVPVTIKICTDDISQGAPICSVDSCRF